MSSDTAELVEVDDARSSESDEERYSPRLMFRGCRTPDCSRIVAVWSVYEDVNNMFPLEKGWAIPDTPIPAPYEIRPVEGKGRGLFATRDIKEQEAIIRERPVLLMPHVLRGVDISCMNALWMQVETTLLQLLVLLEPEDRKKYLELHNCKSPDECGPLAGIMRTNALGAEFTQSDYLKIYAGVCLNISYANHSCTPNARYAFNSEDVMFSLLAERDITAGEEITISYTSVLASRAQRREKLERKYCFTCACTSCAKPDVISAESDECRKFLNKTLDELSSTRTWKTWVNCPLFQRKSQAQRLIETDERFLRDAEIEGLPRRRWKLQACIQCAGLCAVLCDSKNFRKWARVWVTVVDDEEEKENIERWIKDPTAFPLWEFDRKRSEQSSGARPFFLR